MFIKIEMTSDVPLYEQLKQRIIEGIAQQKLVPGEELPSVRQLAADLSVNMHTVAKAYGQLKEAGFLSVHRNRGAVVNSPEDYAADENYLGLLKKQLSAYAAEAICRGIEANEWQRVCTETYVNQNKKGCD